MFSMLTLTVEQSDWLGERISDAAGNSKGGRPSADKWRFVWGIFCIVDHAAKCKDLPREFGCKRTVHRWFRKWGYNGVFENIMRQAGHCVEVRGGYLL